MHDISASHHGGFKDVVFESDPKPRLFKCLECGSTFRDPCTIPNEEIAYVNNVLKFIPKNLRGRKACPKCFVTKITKIN